MPGKTGRGKRKYSPLGKKKKSRRVSPVMAAHEPPVTSGEVPVTAEVVSPPVAPATPFRYPYIFSELRRIGILSGVILAILIVLALVLS